jgi:hypothetical protein
MCHISGIRKGWKKEKHLPHKKIKVIMQELCPFLATSPTVLPVAISILFKFTLFPLCFSYMAGYLPAVKLVPSRVGYVAPLLLTKHVQGHVFFIPSTGKK